MSIKFPDKVLITRKDLKVISQLIQFSPFLTRTQPILLQAQDEEDRKSWLAAMDGKEPVSNKAGILKRKKAFIRII